MKAPRPLAMQLRPSQGVKKAKTMKRMPATIIRGSRTLRIILAMTFFLEARKTKNKLIKENMLRILW